MLPFVLNAVALATAVIARFESDEVLQQYFWDDNLWDTINTNKRFSQKCISDAKWSQLCMCSYTGTNRLGFEAEAFLCDIDEGFDEYLRSSAELGFRNFAVMSDYYDDYYYFPGSAANTQYALPADIEKIPSGNFWTMPEDLKAFRKCARNHAVPAPELKEFWNAIKRLPESSAKGVFELLFDEMDAALVCTLFCHNMCPRASYRAFIVCPLMIRLT